jgi:hypothetical protein
MREQSLYPKVQDTRKRPNQWLKSLSVSVNSVDSVRAFLPPDSGAPHISRQVPLFSRKEKNSHGGHGGFDR